MHRRQKDIYRYDDEQKTKRAYHMNTKTNYKSNEKFLNEIKEELIKKYDKIKKVEEAYQDQLDKKLPEDSKEALDLKQAQGVAESVEDMEQNELMLIAQALKRISDGTYGVCVDCSKPIPVERLRAIPYAENCVTCKAKKEEEGE